MALAWEVAVITAAVLGGVDINGGIGTMGGAVLSLLVIGLLRFGMGRQHPGPSAGHGDRPAVILSILSPNIVRNLSARGHVQRQSLVQVALAAAFTLFILFFFWSGARGVGR